MRLRASRSSSSVISLFFLSFCLSVFLSKSHRPARPCVLCFLGFSNVCLPCTQLPFHILCICPHRALRYAARLADLPITSSKNPARVRACVRAGFRAIAGRRRRSSCTCVRLCACVPRVRTIQIPACQTHPAQPRPHSISARSATRYIVPARPLAPIAAVPPSPARPDEVRRRAPYRASIVLSSETPDGRDHAPLSRARRVTVSQSRSNTCRCQAVTAVTQSVFACHHGRGPGHGHVCISTAFLLQYSS